MTSIQTRTYCRRGLLAGGLALLAGGTTVGIGHRTDAALSEVDDHRTLRLRAFFDSRNSPLRHHAGEFVRVADQHKIDWRLLPSIAVVESSAGKHYRNNNVFGWNNGQAKFSSVAHGIRAVGHSLGRAHSYRSKSTAQKLRTYNPNAEYARQVMALMNTISSSASSSPGAGRRMPLPAAAENAN